MYGIVSHIGFDMVLMSKHKSKEVAQYKCDRMNEGVQTLFGGNKFSVILLSDYRIADIFNRVLALPK